jgi:hypothetical protein
MFLRHWTYRQPADTVGHRGGRIFSRVSSEASNRDIGDGDGNAKLREQMARVQQQNQRLQDEHRQSMLSVQTLERELVAMKADSEKRLLA